MKRARSSSLWIRFRASGRKYSEWGDVGELGMIGKREKMKRAGKCYGSGSAGTIFQAVPAHVSGKGSTAAETF